MCCRMHTMKIISLLLVGTLLAGCNANMQRTLGYGPYQYCRAGDMCAQAGDNWQFYPMSSEDPARFAAESRACWAEENRANWDSCTESFF